MKPQPGGTDLGREFLKPEVLFHLMLEARVRAELSLSAAAKALEVPACMGLEPLCLWG